MGEYEVRVGLGDQIIIRDIRGIRCVPTVGNLGCNLHVGMLLHGVLESLFDENGVRISGVTHNVEYGTFHLSMFFLQEFGDLTRCQNAHLITASHRMKINLCAADYPVEGNDWDACSSRLFNTVDNCSAVNGCNDDGFRLLRDGIVQLV